MISNMASAISSSVYPIFDYTGAMVLGIRITMASRDRLFMFKFVYSGSTSLGLSPPHVAAGQKVLRYM